LFAQLPLVLQALIIALKLPSCAVIITIGGLISYKALETWSP
jgi:hypothetical protein